MPHSYSQSELTKYFYEALDMFNDCLDSDISKDNLVLDYFNPENGVAVYERFCQEHFPNMLEETNYKEPGYFASVGAQAFVSDSKYGVLINERIDFTLAEVLQTFLHEISHLYCTRNEIEDGNFFDKYCMGSGPENGMMNAGYAIWREAVADIMADSVISDYTTTTLRQVRPIVQEYFQMLVPRNPGAKKAMSLIIVFIMISSEVASVTQWELAEKEIAKAIQIEDRLLFSILKQVFEQLQSGCFWKITPDFIITLGETYLCLISDRSLRNTLKT